MSTHISIRVTFDGKPCVLPQMKYGPAAQQANSYCCPLGPATGRGWVLLLESDLQAVLANGPYHALKIETAIVGVSSGASSNSTAARSIEFPKLLVEKTARLSPGGANDPNNLHLVELVDKRAVLARFSDSGGLQMNLRALAQADDYLTGTGGATWASALEAVWNTMSNLLGSFPGLPAGVSPAGGPENLHLLGTNAWWALEQLLAAIGCTTCYDPVLDQFRIVQLGATQQNLPAVIAQQSLLLDLDPQPSAACRVPETIRVWFHNHYRNRGQERDTEIDDNWLTAGWGESIDVPTAHPDALPGTVLGLWDDLPRVFDENNSLANASEISARASARASDWLRMHAPNQNRWQIYSGLLTDIRPGEQIKAVLWHAAGTDSSNPASGGLRTELISHAGLVRRVQDLTIQSDEGLTGGYLAGAIDWQGDTSLESFAPPDLARSTAPNYPQLVNLVRADDGDAATGELISPNEQGVMPGHVVRWVAGGLQTLEACWIRPCDLPTGSSPDAETVASLRQNDIYLGRLSGLLTSGGSQRPLYVLHAGEGNRADVLASCEASGSPVARVDGLRSLIFDRGASFLLRANETPGNAIVSLGGGPTWSVFAQDSGGGAPQWWETPHLLGITLGNGGGFESFLRFANDGTFDLVAPTSGTQAWRLPSALPGSPDDFLVATAKQAAAVQLGWRSPGGNGSFYGPTYGYAQSYVCGYCESSGYWSGYVSAYEDPPAAYTVQNGLIIAGPGITAATTGDGGSVAIEVVPQTPFDPCAE